MPWWQGPTWHGVVNLDNFPLEKCRWSITGNEIGDTYHQHQYKLRYRNIHVTPEFLPVMNINITVFRDGKSCLPTFQTKLPASHVEEWNSVLIYQITRRHQERWCSHNALELNSRDFATPAILTDTFVDFLRPFRVNVWILPPLGYNRFFPNPFPVQRSGFIVKSDATLSTCWQCR
jgi:hypothetical protein